MISWKNEPQKKKGGFPQPCFKMMSNLAGKTYSDSGQYLSECLPLLLQEVESVDRKFIHCISSMTLSETPVYLLPQLAMLAR